MEVLKTRAKVRHIKNNLVFFTMMGSRIRVSNLHRAFYQVLKRAGIQNFRWHDLRHTFATRLAQAGVDLYKIQKLGRWRQTSMLSRYAHHCPESLRDGVEILDEIRKKISTNLAQLSDDGIGHDG
jgi:site-specific recombinase XerD